MYHTHFYLASLIWLELVYNELEMSIMRYNVPDETRISAIGFGTDQTEYFTFGDYSTQVENSNAVRAVQTPTDLQKPLLLLS